MKKALVGKKIGMTQVFTEDGRLLPVTVLELGPNVVVQKKIDNKDGYLALKVGFEDIKEKLVTKPVLGIFKKAAVNPKRHIKEIDSFQDDLEIGSQITCEIFSENEIVSVTGESKGKGFAGTIKRHGFSGGRASHGSSFHRAPGSIGANTFPAKVWKGKKMAGRMGSDRVTVKNLKIVKIIKEKNLVFISGAVPGRKDSLVVVQASV